MKKATNQDTLKALRIAEIKATDKEDFNNCVSDLVKTASLDTDEAKIIANAIRSKFLPNILREAGFEDDERYHRRLSRMAQRERLLARGREIRCDRLHPNQRGCPKTLRLFNGQLPLSRSAG